VESNRNKADIVQELRQNKFRPFPKAARETEDVEVNDDAKAEAASGTLTDRDYLLGMAIWSLTKEKVRTPCSLVHMGCSRLSPFAGLQIKKVLQRAADKEKDHSRLGSIAWNSREQRYSQPKIELYGLSRTPARFVFT